MKVCSCSSRSFCMYFISSQHLSLEFSIYLLHIHHSQGFQSVPVNRSQGNLHFKVKETSANAWLLPLMHKSRDLLEFCSEWMESMSHSILQWVVQSWMKPQTVSQKQIHPKCLIIKSHKSIDNWNYQWKHSNLIKNWLPQYLHKV